MAKIKITQGTYNSTCTSELNLTQNHLLDPSQGFDKTIMYAEQRYLMTFLVAGAVDGRYTVPGLAEESTYRTKVGMVPEGELMDGNAWKYRIMGRIQKSCEIVGSAAVGVPTAGNAQVGGFFSIQIKDNYIVPGMNVVFHNGKMARCMERPTGAMGAYTYRFQCFPGDTFSWATWVAPQPGTKTCFGGFTTYGERSLRGYGNVHYPDSYINHMTTQRKAISISGDANANRVLWYEYNGSKGWIYEAEAQARAQFLLEDEFQKWWGKSTMKDAYGNLLAAPSMTDAETGEPIVAGDGLVEQIRGANDMDASGVDGCAVYDDFSDMIVTLKKKSNANSGKIFYAVTGADGMLNAHNRIAQLAKDGFASGYYITSPEGQNNKPGGASPAVGFNFRILNVAGNQLIFVENPMMDDEMRFPRRLNNGKLAMSNTYYIIDASPDNTGRRNVEIRARGREGINRNMVYYWSNGMTGDGKADNSVDAKSFEILKQNVLAIFNTKSCGIIQPPATA